METTSTEARSTARPKPLLHACLFVLGFSIIFIALGMTMSGIGQLVFDIRTPLARAGGVIVMLFGLATMGLFGDLSRRLGHLEHTTFERGGSWWLVPARWTKAGIDLFLRYFYADTRLDASRYATGGYLSSF
ncbi:MAG: cytochrome c biogenesis protein CcdA, partial [Nitrospira sp.]|nr:cytochrome c biogenesis protein CcdA [Nitrospira sp.]